MFRLSNEGGRAVREKVSHADLVGEPGHNGRSFTVRSLFVEIFECPQCRATDWDETNVAAWRCGRCGFVAKVNGRHISLLPEQLSVNNAGEAEAYDTEDEESARHLFEYSMKKPDNFPPGVRAAYLRCAEEMKLLARDLGRQPSILFVFGGGGMEAHLSGLLGPNVVLADISATLLDLAEKRYDYHQVAQPAAFVTSDAERLPFRSGSFDLVIGFEGIHHCLIPQAALQEIWRVSRRRTYIVDNLECTLTRIMYRFGKSSQIETSGVKPNRFTLNALQTLLYNAQIDYYHYAPRSLLPNAVRDRLPEVVSRGIEKLLDALGQANMFVLSTDKKTKLP